MLELSPENIGLAFSALAGIGYRPIVPITAADFADPRNRAAWVREKGMTVPNFWWEQHRDTPVDLFVTEPFDGINRGPVRVDTLFDPHEGDCGTAAG